MASNVGEAYQNAANARASGYVGTANAFTNALNTGLNFYQGQQYLNAIRPTDPSLVGPRMSGGNFYSR